MAEKWHIGKDGQPHICTAQAGKCPLGGDEAHHYASKNDCYKAIEKQAEASFVKNSGSLKKAAVFKKKYRNWEDDDPEINKIIERGLSGKEQAIVTIAAHLTDTEEGVAYSTDSHKTMRIKTMRQSDKTKAMIHDLRTGYAQAESNMKELKRANKYNTALACAYKSKQNLDADMNLLKDRLRETMAMDHVNNNTTIGDVAYKNSDNPTALYVSTATSFDSEALAHDMAEAGYDVSDVQESNRKMNTSAIRAYVNSRADAELGIKPGTKGAPARRAEYLENSGVFKTTTSYSPDADAVNRLAGQNTHAVINSSLTKEDVDKMESASQVRSVLCELGYQRNVIQAEIDNGEKRLRDAGGSDQNAMFRASADKKTGAVYASEKMEGLRYKARSSKSLVSEGAAKRWIASHGGDPDSPEFYSTSSRVTLEKLSEFHEKHPEISVYKYAKPTHRVAIRDLVFGDGKNRDDVAARDLPSVGL